MRFWVWIACSLLLCCAALAQSQTIEVGPAVHVSKPQQNFLMREILVSADPQDPRHLLGCGIAYDESRGREWTVVYVSKDAGASWQTTLQTDNFEMSGDPACALGRDGLATHMVMAFEKFSPEAHDYVLRVYRSTDGGMTWPAYTDLPMRFQGIDRESVTVDTSEGKYKNRIYVSGTSHARDLAGGSKGALAVWTSPDGGKTFLGPVKRGDAGDHYVLDTGNSAVLSDGSLVTVFGDLKKSDGMTVTNSTPGEPNAELLAVRTTKGGDSLSEAVKVDDFYMINIWDKAGSPPSHSGPMLAADSSKGPFKDRVYAVWSDNRDGRGAIRISYSPTKGRTWSHSVVIDDVPGPVTRKGGPENFQPTVAVNKEGVVLVVWYDRRDTSDGLGWYIRGRASLDGGETWLPSVRISSDPNLFSSKTKMFVWASSQRAKPSTGISDDDEESDSADKVVSEGNPAHMMVAFSPRQFFAGDYAGLTADAAGAFHAFWIDNRTGMPQIWTTSIHVPGKAIKNGEASLTSLNDVSSDVEIRVSGNKYDRATNTVAVTVQLRNASKKTVRGPIKLRLVSLSSPYGTPSVENADNQVAEPGATWDFTSALQNNELKKDELSAKRELIFKIDRPLGLLDENRVRMGLLDCDIRVLASTDKREETQKSSD